VVIYELGNSLQQVALGYPSDSGVKMREETVTDTPSETLMAGLKEMVAALRDYQHSESMLQVKDFSDIHLWPRKHKKKRGRKQAFPK
jgi:hypothetical protein